MSRSYMKVVPKKYWVYSVEGLMRLYSVNANTISNWVSEGLAPSDNQRPYVFQGAAVQHFHKIRHGRTERSLRPGEFKCFTCKGLVFPDAGTVRDTWSSYGKHIFAARCPECGAEVRKISNEADRSVVEDCRNPNTSRDCLHEDDGSAPGGIGITKTFALDGLHTANDRIIHEWLTYAGQYDVKTVDRHLSAIRYCEKVLAGKSFSKLTREDVAKVRDDLKRRSVSDATDSWSSSSIKHVVSHLSAFFDWLLKQNGFKSLPQDLQGYLRLPKAVLAAATPVQEKDYPSIEEAECLLAKMPSQSLFDQRARAIFAIAFLGSLRADTLISLRIKHVDIDRHLILQDGRKVRAKAGKSIHIYWFPIPSCFGIAITDWVHSLRNLGFTDVDALFPPNDCIKHRPMTLGANRKPVAVMSTTYAVTAAFAVACRDQAVKFTPHSAKDCISAERDKRPLTQLQRKAWSENMGHENEQITERHYGKLTNEQRFEVLEQISANPRLDVVQLSDDEKIALVDGLLDFIRNK
jgi:integrase